MTILIYLSKYQSYLTEYEYSKPDVNGNMNRDKILKN